MGALSPRCHRVLSLVLSILRQQHRARSIQQWRAALLLTTVPLLILGCASPPPPVIEYSREEKMAAAEHILQTEIKLMEIAGACKTLDHESQHYAIRVQQAWHERYWPEIAAANQHYLNNLRLQQQQRGEVDGQLELLHFKLLATEERKQRISERMARMNLRLESCQRYLRPFQVKGDHPSILNPQHLPVLVKLKESYPGVLNTVPHPVLDYSTQLKPKRLTGRSFYLVEKETLKSNYCLNAEVINLHDHWPNETFGVFCPKRQPIAIKCTWGQCALDRLYQ